MPVQMLSRYFSVQEMFRSDLATRTAALNKHQNEAPPEVYRRLAALCIELDKVREFVSMPIYVTSGYRCKQLNAAVNGAPTSQHVVGEAADINLTDVFLEEGKHGIRKEIERYLPEQCNIKGFPWDRVNANFYLLVGILSVFQQQEYMIGQLIHEYGSLGKPAWIHFSIAPADGKELKDKFLIIGKEKNLQRIPFASAKDMLEAITVGIQNDTEEGS